MARLFNHNWQGFMIYEINQKPTRPTIEVLKQLNNEIIRKAQKGEPIDSLMAAERIVCKQYLCLPLCS